MQILSLHDLNLYKLTKALSKIAWDIYRLLDWQNKKIMGDQFIRATDSVGANLAEGYGRFHYLDRIKFMYNARGSLLESKHWFDLLCERELIRDSSEIQEYLDCYKNIGPMLNSFINSLYQSKRDFPNN